MKSNVDLFELLIVRVLISVEFMSHWSLAADLVNLQGLSVPSQEAERFSVCP